MLLLVLVALLAPILALYPPDLIVAESRLQPPSPAHPFGTDALGRDLYSRVVYGARIAVGMAILGVGIAVSVGVVLGLVAGFRGQWSDQILSRVMEVWLAFPGLLLAIIIVARLGPSLKSTVIALSVAACVFAITIWMVYTLRRAPSSLGIFAFFLMASFTAELLLQRFKGRRILADRNLSD